MSWYGMETHVQVTRLNLATLDCSLLNTLGTPIVGLDLVANIQIHLKIDHKLLKVNGLQVSQWTCLREEWLELSKQQSFI